MSFQGDSIYWVEIEKIVPNPFQPRREFDEAKLQELADSVRMYGILQPLTVTRKEIQREDGTFFNEYELIAGERRLRASKIAGLAQVPVTIREGEDTEQEKLELAIIENLQREDLNSVDRALAFQQLEKVFNLSHKQISKKVGRSREYVSNTIRLLNLPENILDSLRRAEITEGHARTLLMLADRPTEQQVVFRETLLKKLSVRELEKIARGIAAERVRKRNPNFDEGLAEIEKQFMETLGTRVQIQKTSFGGKLTIDYFSVEDLEAMLRKMKEDQIMLSNGPLPAEVISGHTPLEVASETEENMEEEKDEKGEVGEEILEGLKRLSEMEEEKDQQEIAATMTKIVAAESEVLTDSVLSTVEAETVTETAHKEEVAEEWLVAEVASEEKVVVPETSISVSTGATETATETAKNETEASRQSINSERGSGSGVAMATLSDNSLAEPLPRSLSGYRPKEITFSLEDDLLVVEPMPAPIVSPIAEQPKVLEEKAEVSEVADVSVVELKVEEEKSAIAEEVVEIDEPVSSMTVTQETLAEEKSAEMTEATPAPVVNNTKVEKELEKNNDDGSLYSMRNFSF